MRTEKDELLDKWMNVYGAEVLRTAFFYVKDISIAEDMFQEVFLKAYKKMNTYRGEASIRTWILKITINQCKDYLKSNWFKRILLNWETKDYVLPEVDTTLNPESIVLHHEERQELLEQVLKISLPLREVLILYYYHDLSQNEIADILKIPFGTVRSRLHRSKEVLKKQLKLGGDYDEKY
ncbi:MAG: sigma-70 family RNA polymerase sigma factor [Epulopiscium sp.]|nr:sigma-70 family RNA polymerase sigma factor [Candidatus Epulonipiscium sp.]